MGDDLDMAPMGSQNATAPESLTKSIQPVEVPRISWVTIRRDSKAGEGYDEGSS